MFTFHVENNVVNSNAPRKVGCFIKDAVQCYTHCISAWNITVLQSAGFICQQSLTALLLFPNETSSTQGWIWHDPTFLPNIHEVTACFQYVRHMLPYHIMCCSSQFLLYTTHGNNTAYGIWSCITVFCWHYYAWNYYFSNCPLQKAPSQIKVHFPFWLWTVHLLSLQCHVINNAWLVRGG